MLNKQSFICIATAFVLLFLNTSPGYGVQMKIQDTGGPIRFDPPQTISTLGSANFANALSFADLNNSNSQDIFHELAVAASDGLWIFTNTPRARMLGLEPIPFHAYQWDDLADESPRKIVHGRVNGDALSDIVMLSRRLTPEGYRGIVHVLYGRGNEIFDPARYAFALGHPAHDLAIATVFASTNGPTGAIICAAGTQNLSFIRHQTTGNNASSAPEVIQTIPINGNIAAIAAMVINGVPAFAITGIFSFQGVEQAGVHLLMPTFPSAANPGYTIVASKPLIQDTDIAGSIENTLNLLFQTGVPRLIVAANLDDDEVPELAVATEGLGVSSGKLYIYKFRREAGAATPLITIEEVDRVGSFGQPTAMTTGILGPPGENNTQRHIILAGRDDEKSPAWVKIFINEGEPGLFEEEQTLELDYFGPESAQDTFDPSGAFFQSASAQFTDIDVGFVNSDNIPDIVLANPVSQQLVIIKGQPGPIATFITVTTHGHRGLGSILHESLSTDTTETVVDEFNRALGGYVNEINRQRRNIAPELPPVRHIGISGQWGDLTENGAALHVAGRAGWLFGMYFTPVPICFFPLIPPIPVVSPIGYWASALWFLPPCTALPDPGVIARFAFGGIGAGAELLGAHLSSRASRQAAQELANNIDRAVDMARADMDPCEGQIYLDLSGHSRGTTVTAEALRRVTTARLAYNAKVHVTYIDAIDPSPRDSWRPWARSGYMMMDPNVGCSVGNEVVSAIQAERPVPNIGSLQPFQGPIGQINPEVGPDLIASEVIGLPVGHDRTSDFGVDTNPVGLMTFGNGLNHNQVMNAYWNPDRTLEEDSTLPEQFSVQNTTALGQFLPGSSPGARAIPMPDGNGWSPAANACDDRRLSGNEQDRLPTSCRPENTDTSSDSSTTTALYATSQSAFGPVRVREYVADPGFNISQNIIEQVRYILDALPKSDKAYRQLFNTMITPEVRNYFIQTAYHEFVPQSIWKTQGKDLRRQVRIRGNSDALTRLTNALKAHSHTHGSGITADIPPEETVAQYEKKLRNLQRRNPEEFSDTISYAERLLSGSLNLKDAYAEFPKTTASLTQDLHPSSVEQKTLYVKIEYQHLSADASLTLAIKTRDYKQILPHSLKRKAIALEIPPRVNLNRWLADKLRLRGRATRVYHVSVRAEGPTKNPINQHIYDVVVHEGGVDWEYALMAATHSTFKGRKGKLAVIHDPEVYKAIQKSFDLDTFVWLGGFTVKDKIKWLDGTADAGKWRSGVKRHAKVKNKQYIYAYFSKEGPFINASAPKSSQDKKPFGYVIDYGKYNK